MPRMIIATSPERLVMLTLDSRPVWSSRCETGANATVVETLSSGVQVGARAAANSADWPP